MFIRRVLILLSLTLLPSLAVAASTPAGPDKETKEAASKLLQSVNMEKSWNEMVPVLAMQLAQGNPEIQVAFEKYLKKVMTYKKVESDMVALYARHYTRAELVELSTFYNTPTGKKSLEIMPKVMGESMQIGQKLVQENQAELAKLGNEIAAKTKKSGK